MPTPGELASTGSGTVEAASDGASRQTQRKRGPRAGVLAADSPIVKFKAYDQQPDPSLFVKVSGCADGRVVARSQAQGARG